MRPELVIISSESQMQDIQESKITNISYVLRVQKWKLYFAQCLHRPPSI